MAFLPLTGVPGATVSVWGRTLGTLADASTGIAVLALGWTCGHVAP